jgi:hypothetical protein
VTVAQQKALQNLNEPGPKMTKYSVLMLPDLIVKNKRNILILLLILSGAIFRVRVYQDSLSIGTADSAIFIQESKSPLSSWDFYTSNRPPTVGFFYKIMEPASGYDLVLVSRAWEGTEPDRVVQPGLDRIALMQSILSILAWSLLAWVVAFRLQTLLGKIMAVGLTLTFAYSPQMADWDGVLMSESLSFSLFVFLLSLLIELAHRIKKEGLQATRVTWGLAVVWLLATSLWVFTRDSGAYGILVTVLLLGMGFLLPPVRKRLPPMLVAFLFLSLSVVFIFHNATLRASDRWVNPLMNNLIKNIMPYPDRLEYFAGLGLPVTEELLSFVGSDGNETGIYDAEGLMPWVYESGFSAYQRYITAHPFLAIQRLYQNLDAVFVANRQPYFRGSQQSTPLWMIPVGDILHLRDPIVLAVDLILTMVLVSAVLLFKRYSKIAWAIVFGWLFICELALLFVSFHGDALGVTRHTLGAVMPARLSMWLLGIVLIDTLIEIKQNKPL